MNFRRVLFTAISIAALVSQAMPAAAENIVDAKGLAVGTLQGPPDKPWVRLRMKDGTWTVVRIWLHGFSTTQYEKAISVSESRDCTGTQYVLTSLTNYASSYRIKTTDQVVLIRYPVPPFKKIFVGSETHWDPSQSVSYCRVISTPYEADVGGFKTVKDTTLRFTPPFSIR